MSWYGECFCMSNNGYSNKQVAQHFNISVYRVQKATKSNNEKHVLYSDVNTILKQIAPEAVISVFQHFRRISFDNWIFTIAPRQQT